LFADLWIASEPQVGWLGSGNLKEGSRVSKFARVDPLYECGTIEIKAGESDAFIL
jgi:hypothetical protein